MVKTNNTHADVLRTLAAVLETHVENAQAKGLTPLLDGIEMARLVRAIANRKPVHRPNWPAAQERLVAVTKGQLASIMAPDIEWPADAPLTMGDA